MRRVPAAAAALAATATMLVFTQIQVGAQKLTPADLAEKISGTWVLNRELSTGFSTPGRRGGGASYERGPRFTASTLVTQRGGRGGGAGGGGVSDATDLTPEERAAQAAMRQLQQIGDRIAIKASAETVTFADGRGERVFAINDKSTKIDVGGSPVNVKSKWDKNVLRQEFSNTQAKLIETWGVDEAGHLVLTAKVESMTLLTPEQKAVFDRQ